MPASRFKQGVGLESCTFEQGSVVFRWGALNGVRNAHGRWSTNSPRHYQQLGRSQWWISSGGGFSALEPLWQREQPLLFCGARPPRLARFPNRRSVIATTPITTFFAPSASTSSLAPRPRRWGLARWWLAVLARMVTAEPLCRRTKWRSRSA